MACYHPIPAWRGENGVVVLREPVERKGTLEFLRLPCSTCIGCRTARAKEWAMRCWLERLDHVHALFLTLTYNDNYLPPTLVKDHVSSYLKRVRAYYPRERVRFFASGEYGEKFERPHYHVLLFGLPECKAVHKSWRAGFVQVDEVTPKSAAYVAGYCSKKIGWKLDVTERIDYETGEVYEWQPPFVLMSRRPGIGAGSKVHWQSWRRFAIYGNSRIPVPRFLHSAWEAMVDDDAKLKLREEKLLDGMKRDSSRARLAAGEAIAKSYHSLSAARRSFEA